MRMALASYRGGGGSWVTDPFRPDCDPVGSWGAFDLRNDPGNVGGYCIVMGNDDTGPIPGALRDLGDPDDAIDLVLSTQAINFIENRLGITVTPGLTLRQLIRDIMIIDWGPGKWNKLRKDPDSWARGIIGNVEIFAVPVVGGGTIFTEDFDTADSTTLGPDLTWTEVMGDAEISGNKWRNVTAAGDCYSRAEHDVGSADMYAQGVIDYTSWGNWAIVARWNHSTGTFYQGSGSSTAAEAQALYRFTPTSWTQIGSNQSFSTNELTGYTYRLECNVDQITHKINGGNAYTQTDTTYNTGQRGGVAGWSAATQIRWNDFTMGALADLVAGQPSGKRMGGVQFAAAGAQHSAMRRW